MKVLLTGATGYVGQALLPDLVQSGYAVRCFIRHANRLPAALRGAIEVAVGDIMEPATILTAMQGIDAAFYLIHSLEAGQHFAERDRQAAGHFARAAHDAGIKLIIYLGGLGGQDAVLSAHLRSRQEVGDILRGSGVPVIEFRASIILGAGSISFEMVRSLTERLPIMITPRWVYVSAQPISIADVISYLLDALTLPVAGNRVFEIGGADQVSYGDLIREYARQRGLHRLILPIPFLTPWLSSLWLSLVTPVYAGIGRLLIEGIKSPTVVNDDAALKAFSLHPMGYRKAIACALADDDRQWEERLETGCVLPEGASGYFRHAHIGTRFVEVQTETAPVPPEVVFRQIQQIGGQHGYFFANWLWRLRWFFNQFVGSPGLQQSRHLPVELAVGDVIEWWRVIAFEPDHRLCLTTEAALPGRAWLDYRVEADAGKSCQVRQTAIFDARGLTGLLYWYLLLPLHRWFYRSLLRQIIVQSAKNLP